MNNLTKHSILWWGFLVACTSSAQAQLSSFDFPVRWLEDTPLQIAFTTTPDPDIKAFVTRFSVRPPAPLRGVSFRGRIFDGNQQLTVCDFTRFPNPGCRFGDELDPFIFGGFGSQTFTSSPLSESFSTIGIEDFMDFTKLRAGTIRGILEFTFAPAPAPGVPFDAPFMDLDSVRIIAQSPNDPFRIEAVLQPFQGPLPDMIGTTIGLLDVLGIFVVQIGGHAINTLSQVPTFVFDLLPGFDYAIVAASPVDLMVEDTDGNMISKDRNDFGNSALYVELAIRDITGSPIDVIVFQNPSFEPEDLLIKVTPNANADPTDTFSLFTVRTDSSNGVTPNILAHDREIGAQGTLTFTDTLRLHEIPTLSELGLLVLVLLLAGFGLHTLRSKASMV